MITISLFDFGTLISTNDAAEHEALAGLTELLTKKEGHFIGAVVGHVEVKDYRTPQARQTTRRDITFDDLQTIVTS